MRVGLKGNGFSPYVTMPIRAGIATEVPFKAPLRSQNSPDIPFPLILLWLISR